MTEACPCGSSQPFSGCCQPLLDGGAASSAEALMRSRYTAFVTGDAEYLLQSWHPMNRPAEVGIDVEQKWLGLKIRHTEAGQADDTHGIVEFVARYKIAGKAYRLHEISRFSRVEGRWVYVDGELLTGERASGGNS